MIEPFSQTPNPKPQPNSIEKLGVLVVLIQPAQIVLDLGLVQGVHHARPLPLRAYALDALDLLPEIITVERVLVPAVGAEVGVSVVKAGREGLAREHVHGVDLRGEEAVDDGDAADLRLPVVRCDGPGGLEVVPVTREVPLRKQ